MNTAVIILAAGSSSRLGKPKQLLQYQGKSLIQHVVDEAKNSNVDEIIVVLGANYELISKEISEDEKIKMVVNQMWDEGMASSIKTGLTYLQKNTTANRALFAVCDQPFVSSALFNRLIQTQKQTNKPIIACKYENTTGTPVLFHEDLFKELLCLQGDHGAKKIIMEHTGEVGVIDFPKGNIDLDTIEQYNALMK